MKSRISQLINPPPQIMTFFSSYLEDITNVVQQIKRLVFNIINIQIPSATPVNIHSNMNSIVIYCNKNFQDLKRIQTMLRGHIRGRTDYQIIKNQNRCSRISKMSRQQKTISQQYQTNLNNRVSRLNFDQESVEGIEKNNKNQEYYNKQTVYSDRNKIIKNENNELRAAKSHRLLINKNIQQNEKPRYSSREYNQNSKNSLELIKKIRTQLGISPKN